MKKSISKALAMLTIFTVACTENTLVENSPIENDGDTITEISITGKDFQFDGDTRSSVSVSESGVSFLWDEDDVIGIFPDKGDQVSFAMDEGAGTQTATFSGGGWALKSSAKYAAYYPHVYENRDMTAIPVSYLGQTQNGNGNTDHIGAYDFMAARVTTPSNGTVAFDMQHLGALVQLIITVPKPSTLTKVVLTSSTKFTETGAIDLTTDIPAIASVTQSNTFEINLNNVTTTEANETVTVYFMTAPVDLTNSELTATIQFVDKTIREVEIAGKNLQAGKAYKFAMENTNLYNNYIDEYGINHGKGIEINGVVWAPVNCGYKAASSTSNGFTRGKLYQWGRKYGQGFADDEIVPTIEYGPVMLSVGQSEANANIRYKYNEDNTEYPHNDWLITQNNNLWNSGTETGPIKSQYDPCPDGWRVPTHSELKTLVTHYTKDTEGWIFYGAYDARENVNTLFLPFTGKGWWGGSASKGSSYGYYWSSSPSTYTYKGASYSELVEFSNFSGDLTINNAINYRYRSNAYSVRCVQE